MSFDAVPADSYARFMGRYAEPLAPLFADTAGLGDLAPGHRAELARETGLTSVTDGELTVSSAYASFDEWWEPYLMGVGPAGELSGGATPTTLSCQERPPAGR